MSTATETKPKANPPAKAGLVPYIMVSDAKAASQFHQRAFGTEEVARMPVPSGDGRLMHCRVHVNEKSLMLNDPMPEHGYPLQAPQGLTLTLIVDDIDKGFSRALEAGATVATMFWGDRYGQVIDSFGIRWAVNESAEG